MALSKVHLATKEEFIDAYNSNKDYTNMARSLGYGLNINNNVRLQIKDRLVELGLELYEQKTLVGNRTKGELFSHREGWQNARSGIQKNARSVFENSNKPKKCCICGYDNHYEVAHIKAVSKFNDDALVSEINDIDNLMALCPNHHWEYDNSILKL